VVAAQLTIDAVGRIVYTRSPSTNLFVLGSHSLVASNSTDIHSLDLSVPGNGHLLPFLLDTGAVSSSFRPGRTRAEDASFIRSGRPPACGSASTSYRPPLTPHTDELSSSLPSVPSDTMPTTSDVTDSEVPQHLRVLFLSNVEEAHLSITMASDFKDLLIQHQDILLSPLRTSVSAPKKVSLLYP